MNKEKAWLLYEDDDRLVGNKNGLIKLKEAIDAALLDENSEVLGFIEDTNLYNIVLSTKSNYLKSYEDYKSTFLQKLGIGLFGTWFLVLPFVAVGFILFSLFAEEPRKEKLSIQPLINALKKDCANKL